MSPVTPRQALPDRLRGAALLGIVVVNAAFLGISADGFTAESIEGSANRVMTFLVIVLAQGKFYLLFSFLFGYSASFILRDNSQPNRRRYLRRLLVLFLFGVVHAIFFFFGDILIAYSILGLLLFALSRLSDRALRRWTIAVFSTAVVLLVIIALLIAAFPEDSASDSAGGLLDQALTTGTFTDAALARFEALPSILFGGFFLQAPMAFAAFILGLRASRVRLLSQPSDHLTLWRSCARWGLAVGLPLQVVAGILQVNAITAGDGWFSPAGALGLALGFCTAPILTAGYVGTVALLIARRPGFMSFTAPAGRMSLTVYIGESVLLSLLYCGYGLGFFGQWGAFAVVLSGIFTWAFLSLIAWQWMKRFDQGPLEKIAALATGKSRPSTDT